MFEISEYIYSYHLIILIESAKKRCRILLAGRFGGVPLP
jgi:hypothetical protein